MRRNCIRFLSAFLISCVLSSVLMIGSYASALTYDYTATQWTANEIEFTSSEDYANPVYTVSMDVEFLNSDTGTTYTVPAFWNGGKQWICRYALTETGLWSYSTSCSDTGNSGLHGRSGTVLCNEYTGDLDVYKHGFVTTKDNTRYFVYADGTPFFYLGEVHFSLPIEELDGIGNISESVARENGITSMFKYIIDYRVKQGFTVIQSQPLARYVGVTGNSWFGDENGTIFDYGVNDAMLEKFRTYDRYFEYIADSGLVHCNTQFSYPEELIENKNITDEELEMLCRYWVARYSAYPVFWATVQEGDKDYYGYDGCTVETNPWIDVFKYVQKYDPYDHPATCHQENAYNTRVENSSFCNLDGYSFFAMQYSVGTDSNKDQKFYMLKEYWNNSRKLPVVNYEGMFDHFWIGPRGARTQGWCAYLNGVFGHGYGIQPIWEFFWASNVSGETTLYGETFSMDDNWLEGLKSAGGTYMQIIKEFLSDFEWWNLEPCFDGNKYYKPTGHSYSFSTIGNDVYIGYLYNRPDSNGLSGKILGKLDDLRTESESSDSGYGKLLNKMINNLYEWFITNVSENSRNGKLLGMKDGNYEIRWFNPRTGEYDNSRTEIISPSNGKYRIPSKPDSEDWVIVARSISD